MNATTWAACLPFSFASLPAVPMPVSFTLGLILIATGDPGPPPGSDAAAPMRATRPQKLYSWLALALNASWLAALLARRDGRDAAWYLVRGLMTADVMSGVYHWFQDSYRTASPRLNRALFDNFQVRRAFAPAPVLLTTLPLTVLLPQMHHEVPWLITKHDWEWVCWELAAGCIVAHALCLCYTTPGSHAWCAPRCWTAPFLLSLDPDGLRCDCRDCAHGFWLFGTYINLVHRWNHCPKGPGFPVPWPLQTARHHGVHHQFPQLRYYCILSVLNNGWMDALRVWPALEYLVFRATGAVSFRMAVRDPQRWLKASHFALQQVVQERREIEEAGADPDEVR